MAARESVSADFSSAAPAATPPDAPAPAAPAADHSPADMPELGNGSAAGAANAIDMLGDVELDVKVELGRSQMLVEDVLSLAPGSVVELDKLAGDPVDVYVNERLVARGEVLVVNDNFCVRINEILSTEG